MNILVETIKSLSKEEVRFFKILSNKTHNDSDRKDIHLFNLIRKDIENYNERTTSTDIYGNKKNNFYQLKNKLSKAINKSITTQHSSKEKESIIQNFILLSKIFKRKGHVKLSYHYLKKAEKEGKKIEAFEMLSTIYTEILKLSHELVSIDIEKYIQRKIKNKKNLNLSQDIDIALSSAMYRIKTTQNFSNNKKDTFDKLNEIINSINKEIEVSKSPKFRIKLFEAISRVLLQKNDFYSLEKYLDITYKNFVKDRLFNKTNHEQKLMMLTYLTNCLYKNNKLEESLHIAKKLKKSMSEYDGLFKSKFLFYYYNALVINFSKLDKNKAIEVLKEAKKNKTIQELPTFGSFIYLNMGLLYYDQAKYKSSIQNISRLILQKDFINLSNQFQLKILICEIIIRYELKQDESIARKIKYIKRKHKNTLNKNKRDNKMISIIEEIIKQKNPKFSKEIQKKIHKIQSDISLSEAENTDIINYSEWLNKIIKK